jgi:hypothetical protein
MGRFQSFADRVRYPSLKTVFENQLFFRSGIAIVAGIGVIHARTTRRLGPDRGRVLVHPLIRLAAAVAQQALDRQGLTNTSHSSLDRQGLTNTSHSYLIDIELFITIQRAQIDG